MNETILKIMPHPIKVLIWEKRADGFKIVKDRARFVNERAGRRYYHFRKGGINKPIPRDYITSNNVAYCYSPDRNTLLPLKPGFESMTAKDGNVKIKASAFIPETITEDLRFWLSQEFRESDSKYRGEPSFWEKYGTIIAPFIILLGSGIFFYILNKSLSETLTGGISEMKSIMSTFQNVGG